MKTLEYFLPGNYESFLTASGRGRTIAAFHVAQGNVDKLSDAEMRRDVLTSLMSPTAVNYWLNEKGWLEKGDKVGRVQMLKLTSTGLANCAASIRGGSAVPTTRAIVDTWRDIMVNGRQGLERKSFLPLSS